LRRRGEELQVYLVKRSPQSGFFPGNYVFPGGGVGSQDQGSDPWEAHADLPAAEIANRFGTAPEISPFCVSAVRETFEEAGVFLGTPEESAGSWLETAGLERISKGLPKGWLRDGAMQGLCTLGLSMLWPWSHWITPVGMPRRFDTRFFIAFMPPGQACSPDCRETVEGIWVRPEEGLAANLRGEIPLSPPTVVTLHQLLPYRSAGDLEAALKTRSWGEPMLPRLVRLPRGAMIVEPWDPEYDRERVPSEDLEEHVLPWSEPFSRIWFHGGLWRPVAVKRA
jgi:8-oxo-dGTP pyrophosphatase MutT (NUDIX family)